MNVRYLASNEMINMEWKINTISDSYLASVIGLSIKQRDNGYWHHSVESDCFERNQKIKLIN